MATYLRSSSPLDIARNHFQRIENGRIFCKAAYTSVAYVGLIEISKQVAGERLRAFKLNTGLWLNPDYEADAFKRLHGACWSAKQLGECDAGGLLTKLSFAQGELPDTLELFVRRTHLEHQDPNLCWSMVVGSSPKRLPATPLDGLYHLDQDGSLAPLDTKVKADMAGVSAGEFLHEPLWGPGGRYGIATSMEPGAYDRWIDQNYETAAKRDPLFAAFSREMSKVGNAPLVYTKEEQQEFKLISARVLRDVMAAKAIQAGRPPPG